MAEKLFVFDTEMIQVANAIREKTGSTENLSFPEGFIMEINSLSTDSASMIPAFEYSGTYSIVDDGDNGWRIKFLTSGIFSLNVSTSIDVFLVGGGAAGGEAHQGGGGGYTKTERNLYIVAGQQYKIIIGAGGVSSAGGQTSAFGYSAAGGQKGSGYYGGNGGSGGAGYAGHEGGVDGGNGTGNGGATGQGTTTREFAEPDGRLYSTGGSVNISAPAAGEPNTGDGGDGGYYDGGSGIVVIRNARG